MVLHLRTSLQVASLFSRVMDFFRGGLGFKRVTVEAAGILKARTLTFIPILLFTGPAQIQGEGKINWKGMERTVGKNSLRR